MQLNKFIAHSGLCSRRKAELLIKEGDITVNSKIITNSAYRVQPQDVVKYKNTIIKPESKIYILLNKPKGYITTVSDEKDRKTVLDLVKPDIKERLYPVGRLDRATTGLLILTNDGALAQKLAHPSHETKKIYVATLDKPLEFTDFNKIKNGLTLEDGFMKVDALEYLDNYHKQVRLALHSGKNHIIRRIFEHLNYKVTKLDRTHYAGLTKKQLPQGYWRFLTDKEISLLQDS